MMSRRRRESFASLSSFIVLSAFSFSLFRAPCTLSTFLRPRGRRYQSRKPWRVVQRRKKLVLDSFFFFPSFFCCRTNSHCRLNKKMEKMPLASKPATASAAAAAAAATAFLLLVFLASAISVASSKAPAPVSFRADDGVVSIASPEEFTETISRSRKAAIVYFYLPRCPACAQTKSVLLTAASKLEVC